MDRKKIIGIVFLVLGIVSFVLSFLFFRWQKRHEVDRSDSQEKVKVIEKPLEKYAFENLRKRRFDGSIINIDSAKILKDDTLYSSFMFSYQSFGKKVSGIANIPKTNSPAPVIVMFRGYVDREKYETGIGTQHAGEVFARAGFITLAPDFLGYGESASPSADPLEERFETYTTALNLLASIQTLHDAIGALSNEGREYAQADDNRVAIWGHSNGGQIALSVLEISGKNYPTVLWAPVSKPFPYSILYYTDEYEDHGKKLRKVVADFEKDYDAENYSLTNYLDWITAPIQLHQGEADEAVPKRWSDQLVSEFKKLKKDITYFTYPDDDHNFAKGSWASVVARNISFYKIKLYR